MQCGELARVARRAVRVVAGASSKPAHGEPMASSKQVWSQPGASAEQVRSKCGASAESARSKPGASAEQARSKRGASPKRTRIGERHARKYRVESDKIQQLSNSLAALPQARASLSKRKIVALLAGDIENARDRGHTLKQIARHLQSCGFAISYTWLRSMIPRQKKARAGKKKPRAVATDGARTDRDGPMTDRDGTAMRVVPPSNAPATREVAPARSSRGAPGEPPPLVFPPGASSVPAGDGRFVPAPDSDVL